MSVNVAAITNPFTLESRTAIVPPGGTIADILDASGITFAPGYNLRVFLNDSLVIPEQYETLKPKENDIIAVRAIPKGGEGKDTGRLMMAIAIIAAATIIAPPLAGLAFNPGTTAFAATSLGIKMGIMAGGFYLMNAICPIPKQQDRTSSGKDPSLYSIEGDSNNIRLWQPVPVVLGQVRIYPPYAARPWTELAQQGAKQSVRMLFCPGYSTINCKDFKLGETSLSSLTIDHIYEYDNFDPDTDILQYFANDVHEDSYNTELSHPFSHTGDTFHIFTTTDTTCDEISFDIAAPNGLYQMDEYGNKGAVAIDLDIRFRRIALEDGTPVTESWTNLSNALEVAREWFPVVSLPQEMTLVQNGVPWTGVPYRFFKVHYNLQDGHCIISVAYSSTNDWTGLFYSCLGSPAGYIELCHITIPPNVTSFDTYKYTNTQGDTPSETMATILDKRSASDATYPPRVNQADFLPYFENGRFYVGEGSLTHVNTMVGAHSSAPIRQTFKRVLRDASGNSLRGQYEIYIDRLTPEADPDAVGSFPRVEAIFLTAVRSITQGEVIKKAGFHLIEMGIDASDQLNGQVSNFNCIATSVCPDWDSATGTWITRETNNPASLYRLVLQGPMNKRPLTDSQIDLTTLQSWHTFCATNGFTYNAYIESQMSIKDILDQICAAGRASRTFKDGLHSIIIDEPRNTIVQHITPRNSWGFSATKTFVDTPQAFRVLFPNEDKLFKTDERLVGDDYPGGGYYDRTNAQKVEELQLPGVTNRDHVWKLGRFHLAQIRLRPEVYIVNMDIENLVCTRGDRVKVSHDVTLWGGGFGRLKTVGPNVGGYITALTLDEPVTMVAGTNYDIRIRLGDGYSVLAQVVTNPGSQTSITLSPGIPYANVPLPGDLFLFGVRGSESVDCLVKAIRPSSNLTAQIELVDYAPAVYTADTGVIPSFTSQITSPIEDYYPTVESIRSDSGVMVRGSDGSLQLRMLVTFSNTTDRDLHRVDHIEGQIRTDTLSDGVHYYSPWETLPTIPGNASEVYISNIERVSYQLRFRYVFRDGTTGPYPTTPYSHTITGKTWLPADATFDDENTVFNNASVHFVINPISDLDLAYYEIRTDTNWGSNTNLIYRGKAPRYILNSPASPTATYYLKACDTSGNYSENADTISPTASTITITDITAIFTSNDCHLSWSASAQGIIQYFTVGIYSVPFSDPTWADHCLRTSTQLRSGVFDYTIEQNRNDSPSPLRDLYFRITAYDSLGRNVVYTAEAHNAAPVAPSIPSLTVSYGSIEASWTTADIDIISFEVAIDTTNPPTASHTTTDRRIMRTGLPTSLHYVRVRASDAFGAGPWSDIASGTPLSMSLTEYNIDVPLTQGIIFSINGSNVQWSTGTLIYQGAEYAITGGSTANMYIWWDKNSTPTTFHSSNTKPALTTDIWIMAIWDGTNLNPAQSGKLIHGGLIQASTITSDLLAANSVLAQHLAIGDWELGLSDSITGGTVTIDSSGIHIVNGAIEITDSDIAGWVDPADATKIDGASIKTGSITLDAINGASGTLVISAEHGIYLRGSDTSPAKLFLSDSANSPKVELATDADGSTAYIVPTESGATNLQIGSLGVSNPPPWMLSPADLKFQVISMAALHNLNLRSFNPGRTAWLSNSTYNDDTVIAQLGASNAAGTAFIGCGSTASGVVPAITIAGKLISGGGDFNISRIQSGNYSGNGSDPQTVGSIRFAPRCIIVIFPDGWAHDANAYFNIWIYGMGNFAFSSIDHAIYSNLIYSVVRASEPTYSSFNVGSILNISGRLYEYVVLG